MWDVKEYFGKTYKGRELPQGIYEYHDKFRAVHFDAKGCTLKSKVCTTVQEAIRNLKIFRDDHHWFGILHNVQDNFGFIYRITEITTGRMYIGSKQYRKWVGPPGGYKCTDVSDDTWFNEDLWDYNDWRYYTSSCKPLQEAITKNPDDFFYEVVSLHKDKLELHIAEINLQMSEDVLEAELEDGTFMYYNANVAGKIFKAPISKSEMLEMREASHQLVTKEIDRYITKPKFCSCGRPLNFGEKPCH